MAGACLSVLIGLGKFITSIFTATINTDTSNAGNSFRNVCTTSGAGGTQVRVTITSSTSAAAASNFSIGKQSTTYNTAATPVELKVAGASGYSISGTSSVTSDWANLATTAGDVLVVIIDCTSSIGRSNSGTLSSFFLATTSYNQASPAGSWTSQTNVYGVSKIEVQ